METQQNTDIIAPILVGTFGTFLLLGFIILFVLLYQKRMLAKQKELQLEKLNHIQEMHQAEIEIIEQEREKIAKNLHDDVGVLLTGINRSFNKISRNPNDLELINSLIKNSENILAQANQQIRSITKELYPTELQKLGYRSAVSVLCDILTKTGTINISFRSDTAKIRMPAKTELQLYRITQEVLNNTIKYSGADTINVEVVGETNTTVSIIHNGKGITNEEVNKLMETSKGLGLKSIYSRLQFINATINYLILENKPTVIIELKV